MLQGDAQTGLRDWLWVIGGVAYIGFLGAHLVLLRDIDDDGDWVLVAVFATFAADTAAYFIGRAFGRTQDHACHQPRQNARRLRSQG